MARGRRSSSVANDNCTSSFRQSLRRPSDSQRHEFSGNAAEFERSVEETLLEAGRWAIFAIRIPGYFPLSISKSEAGQRTLKLKLLTLPTLYTIIVGFLSVCGSTYFIQSYCQTIIFGAKDDLKCFDNTITVIWTTMTFLVIYTTYLRCSRIFYVQSSLAFWRGMVTMLESIVEKGYTLNNDHLEDIYKRIFFSTLVYQTTSLIRIIFNVYGIYKAFQDDCSTRVEIVASYLDLFIAFTLCYHVGYALWLTFLITVFTMCFKIIHEDLDKEAVKFQTLCELGLGSQRPSEEYVSRDLTPRSHRRFRMEIRSNYIREEMATPEVSKDIEHTIQKTLSAYTLIEEQMQKFNAHFGVTLILETFFIFLYVVMSVYCVESFFRGDDYLYALTQLIPVAIFGSAFFNLASQSSILSGSATGTLKKLESFFIPTARPQLQTLQLKVLALTARVADNPPSISASHFFNMNRHLLTSFLGTVTTYLVVLLQSRGNPPNCSANTTCSDNTTSRGGIVVNVS